MTSPEVAVRSRLFEDKRIRTAWDTEKEEWYFSVVDVVGVLTDSPNPSNYWKVLKKRLKDEENQLVTLCNQLKLKFRKDGKYYLTDGADTEQLLRMIQSIPSPKTEPFKIWLAQVGREEIMGLTWDCVGFEGKKIRLAGVRTMAGKDVVTKDPKTFTSVRGCVNPNSVPGFGIFTLTLIVPADLPEGKAGRPLP